MVSKFRLPTTKSDATNAAITRTLEIANNYAGELSIEVLPLDKVELDPDNKRDMVLTLLDAMNGISKEDPEFNQKNKDWKSLESLAKTIKEDQLINPIFVYRFGNKCRLIAGERRTLASAIAGKKEIIARIASERPVGTKLRVLQWIENNERQNLSLAERIQSLESILEAYYAEQNYDEDETITASLLSDLTGMSLTQAKRYNLILNSEASIKNAVMNGEIENIKLVELICAEENDINRGILLNAAIAGSTFQKILQMKNELQAGKKIIQRKNNEKHGVPLGKVSATVVKMIMDALVSSDVVENEATQKIHVIMSRAKWAEQESVAKAFKQIAAILELEARVVL